MELTFITDLGQTFVVEIDPNMELENVMALLEAEVRSTLHNSSIAPKVSKSPSFPFFFWAVINTC